MPLLINDCIGCGRFPELDVQYKDWYEGDMEIVLYCPCSESPKVRTSSLVGAAELWNLKNDSSLPEESVKDI